MSDEQRQRLRAEEERFAQRSKELGLSVDPPEQATPEKMQQQGESMFGDFVKNAEEHSHMPDPVKGVVKGGIKAVEDLANLGIDAANWFDDYMASKGIGEDDPDWENLGFAPPPNENSLAEKAGFVVGRYLAPFGAISKGIKALNIANKAVRGGTAITGAAAWSAATVDPDDKNLSDLLESSPTLAPFVPQFLTSDPKDTKFEKRLKVGLESFLVDLGTFGTGKLVKGTMTGMKATRARNAIKKINVSAEEVAPKMFSDDAEVKLTQMLADAAKEPDNITGEMLRMAKNSKQATDVLKLTDNPSFMRSLNDVARGTTTIDEVTNKAAQIYASKEEMTKLYTRKPGTALNAEQQAAIMMDTEATWRQLSKQLSKGKITDDAEKAVFLKTLSEFQIKSASLNAAGSEAGLALRSLQELFEPSKVKKNAEAIEEFTKLLGNDVETLSHFMGKLAQEGVSGAEVAEQLFKKGWKQKTADAVYELWFNNVLSGLSTHAVNAVSNASVVAMAPIDTLVAAGISKNKAVYYQEAGAMMHGYMSSLHDGLVGFKKILINEEIPEGIAQKVGSFKERTIGAELFGFDPDTFLGKIAEGVGKTVTAPTRALMASDAVFKMMNYRGRVHQKAMRAAIEAGTGDTKKLYRKLIKNPPSEFDLSAKAYAHEQTFTSPIKDAAFGQQIDKLSDFIESTNVGKVIVPFMRVGANLNDYAIQRMPLLGKLSPKTARQLSAGGADRAEALARMTTGAGLLALGSYMTLQGRYTGSGTKNYKQENALRTGDTGWQPNSFKIGDTYYSIERVQPFSTMMKIASDMTELATYVSKEDQGSYADLALAATSVLADNLTPTYLTEDVPAIFEFLDKVKSGDLKTGDFAESLGKFASELVPYSKTAKDFNKIGGVRKDTKADPEAEGLERAWQAAKRNFMYNMGFGDSLPTQRNIFGEEIKIPDGLGPDLISPFRTSKESDDFVSNELKRLGMHSNLYNPEPPEGEQDLQIKLPSRYIRQSAGGGLMYTKKLTPVQYEKYIKYSAGIGMPGPPLKEMLSKILKNDEVTDEMKKVQVKKIIGAYRKRGRQRLIMEEDSILDKQKMMRLKRGAALTGQLEEGEE